MLAQSFLKLSRARGQRVCRESFTVLSYPILALSDQVRLYFNTCFVFTQHRDRGLWTDASEENNGHVVLGREAGDSPTVYLIELEMSGVSDQEGVVWWEVFLKRRPHQSLKISPVGQGQIYTVWPQRTKVRPKGKQDLVLAIRCLRE